MYKWHDTEKIRGGIWLDSWPVIHPRNVQSVEATRRKPIFTRNMADFLSSHFDENEHILKWYITCLEFR